MSRNHSTRSLAGKVALVTGASRGIGRSTAIKFADDGALVAVHYCSRSDLAQEVVQEIRARGGDAFMVQADFSSLRGVDSLFEQLDQVLIEKQGSREFDILVNNAAIAPRATLAETTESMFDQIYQVNVKAPFFIAQKAESRLRKGGRVINLSSIVTRIGYPPEAAYAMLKGSIDVLTLVLAKQLGPRQITVNTISPGVIDTDMNKELLADPNARRYVEEISVLQRVGHTSDVADIAAFLATDQSRWMTGQTLDASGGSFIA
jgi:NAD(P)-dependent dehydrogenase (short-subunit alcohol dehydrogenase family)